LMRSTLRALSGGVGTLSGRSQGSGAAGALAAPAMQLDAKQVSTTADPSQLRIFSICMFSSDPSKFMAIGYAACLLSALSGKNAKFGSI